MKTLKIGIIGTGFGQISHLPAFRADHRCSVHAIACQRREQALAAAKRHDVPKSYVGWESLIADPEIDAVSIAVPPCLQPEIAVAAAQAGKHVFCEKPAAQNISDSQRMLEAAERHKIVHAIDFIFPEIPAFRKAKDILASNDIGSIRHATLCWHTEIVAIQQMQDNWKLSEQSGGGALNSFGSHSFYYLEWLLGPITSMFVILDPRDTACDLRISGILRFASGCDCSISIVQDAYMVSKHELEIFGDKGTLIVKNAGEDYVQGFELSCAIRRSGRMISVEPGIISTEVDGRVFPCANIIRRFVDAILTGVTVAPNLHHGHRVQQLIHTARESLRSGTFKDIKPA